MTNRAYSLKNPEVKMQLIITGPAVLGAIIIQLFYGIQPLSPLLVMVGVITYFIWLFLYNRTKKRNGSHPLLVISSTITIQVI